MSPSHEPSPSFTVGAKSRFQRVILVQLVLSIRGLRCSARPVMYREASEVASCRNWSAKMSGATVVFSLQGETRLPHTPGYRSRDGPCRGLG
jgi:hypothetical protein